MGGGFSSSTNYVSQSTAGEVATGLSNSTNYALKTGYQQMLEVYISLTGGNNVTMSPSIGGVAGGTANGSTTVTVTTDSSSGYSLSIAVSSNPAMQKGASSIADYVQAGAPDFTFTTLPNVANFGYTPEGVDVVQRFKDNGSVCNTGSLNTVSACWDGLSTTAKTIASKTSSNHPNGATTSVRFRVGIGASVIQPPGIYTATTTLTALAL